MKLIFDVYPLLNSHYTGIPQTTWHLLRNIDTLDIDCLFTIGYRLLSEYEAERFILHRSGVSWKNFLINDYDFSSHKFLSQDDFKNRIYFSPHVLSCTVGRGLGVARIVHDISSLTLPRFHGSETVKFDANNLLSDLTLCDLIFTVSESSKTELIRYLGVDPAKIVVAYPGVEWFFEHFENTKVLLFDTPYVLILATAEPRKNLDIVLRYLCANKRKILGSRVRYVFAGPDGWGSSGAQAYKNDLQELTEAGRLCFTGFIAEEYKLNLLYNARYMIFPSFFEGFGSPVAEALSVGTPVVCSCGGSLPEVGASAVYYFNPESIGSLSDAILALETDIELNMSNTRQTSFDQGQKFSWSAFADIIFRNMSILYERKVKCLLG